MGIVRESWGKMLEEIDITCIPSFKMRAVGVEHPLCKFSPLSGQNFLLLPKADDRVYGVIFSYQLCLIPMKAYLGLLYLGERLEECSVTQEQSR